MTLEQELRNFMQEQVERSVRMETKLDVLVGAPGVKGVIPELRDDVDELKESENKRRGAFWMFTSISGALIAFLEFIFHKK